MLARSGRQNEREGDTFSWMIYEEHLSNTVLKNTKLIHWLSQTKLLFVFFTPFYSPHIRPATLH